MKEIFVLDIGSQSISALAISKNVIWEKSYITRVSQGGKITLQGAERLKQGLLQAINECPVKKRAMGVATGIFRKCAPSELLDFINNYAEIEIISPEKEGALGVLGLWFRLNIKQDFSVVDLGGATTEFSFFNYIKFIEQLQVNKDLFINTKIFNTISTPMGAYTVKDPKLGYKMGFNYAKKIKKDTPLWGIGGTFTTLGALDLGLERYDANKVNEHWLSEDNLLKLNDFLQQAAIEELKMHPLINKRAYGLKIATSIALGIVKGWGKHGIYIGDAGVKWGLAGHILNWRLP